MALVSRFSTVAMRFTRFQTALLCVALTLAAVALSRVMTVELEALKAAVLGESPPSPENGMLEVLILWRTALFHCKVSM